MINKKGGWKVISIIFFTMMLIVFYCPLLFLFQRSRLKSVGCSIQDRGSGESNTTHSTICQKLWVHRVNTFERLKTVADYFEGIETDLVFDSSRNTFRINHPPAPLDTLTINTYLQWLQGTRKRMWLDIKLITQGQVEAAVQCFLRLDSLYRIKNRIIVESSLPTLINILASKGFSTSYYVPVDLLLNNAAYNGSEINSSVIFVSQEDIYIPRLKQFFPNKKIITWALSFSNYFNTSHLSSLLADTSIKVVLVNIKSKHYK